MKDNDRYFISDVFVRQFKRFFYSIIPPNSNIEKAYLEFCAQEFRIQFFILESLISTISRLLYEGNQKIIASLNEESIPQIKNVADFLNKLKYFFDFDEKLPTFTEKQMMVKIINSMCEKEPENLH
jgi:hypothetical protein